MHFLYPRDTLDVPQKVADQLGSFWSRTYGGREQILAYCEGLGRAYKQVFDNIQEAQACLAIETLPVLHSEEWQSLIILQSNTTSPQSFLEYDDPRVAALFSDDYTYGIRLTDVPVVYDVPDTLAAVALIFNRITTPSLSLVAGLDFVLVDGAIIFRTDPFLDPGWATTPVFDENGTQVDLELNLWLFRPSIDRHYVNQHFGYVFGLDLPSTQNSKELVASLWESIVGGTSTTLLHRALTALTGIPFVRNAKETVIDVVTDDVRLQVLTDLEAYTFPAAATPLVTVGQVVHVGDALCDALRVDEFNRGIVPEGLVQLATGRGFLGGHFIDDLVWRNEAVPLVVTSDTNGITRVSFELDGFPADVDEFWDIVHARGVANGQTLANLLDIRTNPTDQPTAASLPKTVIPLQFLVQNILRDNVLLVRVKVASLPNTLPDIGSLRLLRRIIPPHTAMIVLIEMPTLTDQVNMSSPEQIATFLALETLVGGPTVFGDIDGVIDSRIVSRTCY